MKIQWLVGEDLRQHWLAFLTQKRLLIDTVLAVELYAPNSARTEQTKVLTS